MSFKKIVQNVTDRRLLKTGNKPEDKDMNVVFADFNFKAR